MDGRVEIPIATLRTAAQILLDHAESSSGAVVALDTDMFWAIPVEHRTNVFAEPTQFTIGQLSESLENVNGVVEDPSSAVSYALVWLADLLRATGETIVA